MTLTIQDLGALGEFLGSIVVLVTLGYLAFQTRQNTMAIGAQLDAARISSMQNLMLTAVTSTDLTAALGEDARQERGTSERLRRGYWAALFAHFQWNFDQARLGLLPSRDESAAAAAIRGIFASSQKLGGWWEETRRFHTPEFVEWIEEQRAKAA